MCWICGTLHPLIRVVDAFDTVVAEARQCNVCQGLPLGPKPIFQMHASARILLVGQAPGRLTHAKGLPFDDVSGDRLRLWMGISRETFYDPTFIACLPMGFCYPGKAKGGDLPPRKECAPRWRPRLLPLLPNITLTLLIGQFAQVWHHPGDGRNLTRRVRDWNGENTIPLPHPSPRNGIWLKANPWFETDVLPILRDKVQMTLHDQ